MIVLDATTSKFQVLMDATATTTESPVMASYDDITTTTFTPIAPASGVTITTGTTAVDLVAAPVASTQRVIKYLSIWNADTAARTVTFRYNYNGTTRNVFKAALNIGDQAVYCNGEWKVIDANGNAKTIISTASVSVGGTGSSTALNNGRIMISSAGAIVEGAAGANITAGGWLQDANGCARVTTQFDKTSDASLANIQSTFKVTAVAGRNYNIYMELYISCGATGGFQVDFNGLTSSAGTRFQLETLNVSTPGIAALSRLTDIATTPLVTTASATAYTLRMTGTILLNTGTIFQPRFAQSVSNGTASSVLVGSFLILKDVA